MENISEEQTEFTPIRFAISDLSIGYLLNMTSSYFKITGNHMLNEGNFDITPEQFAILYVLNKEDGLYQRQISKILIKDRPNMSRLINILEKKNFLHRQADPQNKRIYKIFITSKGRDIVKQILPLALDINVKSAEGLSKDDVENLKRILRKIAKNLENSFEIRIDI